MLQDTQSKGLLAVEEYTALPGWGQALARASCASKCTRDTMSQAAPAQPENQRHQPFLSPVPGQDGQGGILLLHPGEKPIPKADKAKPKLSSFIPSPALPAHTLGQVWDRPAD